MTDVRPPVTDVPVPYGTPSAAGATVAVHAVHATDANDATVRGGG